MKLIEITKDMVFVTPEGEPPIRFITQDHDGMINKYNREPKLPREGNLTWTDHDFIDYHATEDGSSFFPVADDWDTTILTIDQEGRTCHVICDTYTMKVHDEDFDYMRDVTDPIDCAFGFVNMILKERGIDITFEVELED